MKINVFVLWRYFREGYNTYLGKGIALWNLLTITFLYCNERIPSLIPNFRWFVLLLLPLLSGVAVFFGWLHIKRSKAYATDLVLSVERNPVAVMINKVSLENQIKLMVNLGIQPTMELVDLYGYWLGLYNELGLTPKHL